ARGAPAPVPAPVAPSPAHAAPGPAHAAPGPAHTHGSHSASTAHLVPDAHPAHALLSVAHALLCPANTLANPNQPEKVAAADLSVLPIDEITFPSEDVSDLRDVVDAINRLCDTMKTSSYEDSEQFEECFATSDPVDAFKCSEPVDSLRSDTVDSPRYNPVDPVDSLPCDNVGTFRCNPVDSIRCDTVEFLRCKPVDSLRCDPVDIPRCDSPVDSLQCSDNVHMPQYEVYSTELVSPEEVSVRKVEAHRAERWRDSQEDAETVTSDTEPAITQFEPISEMYYTASSEVSLLSDLDIPDKVHIDEDILAETSEKVERKECVIAGHVAAMRERFESMTRTNTPCPDLMRSTSPSLDVFRNITPSPDHLG
ncbi:uncharacterized protein ACR2FA_003303, partial [Aphomia sociella]